MIGGTDRLDCRPCGGSYPALLSGVEKVKDGKHGACMLCASNDGGEDGMLTNDWLFAS